MINLIGLEAKHYKITPAGIEELEKQLIELKQRRKQITDEIQAITSQSNDIGSRDDSTRMINQDEASQIDTQIELTEAVLSKAERIERPTTTEFVQVGSEVTIDLEGKEQVYMLVSPVEADPAEHKISYESPLGESLLGKRVHDEFEIITPTDHRTNAIVRSIQ